GAIRWANISTIYYGATSEDADMIGFRDQVFYDESYQNIKNIDRTECLQVFRIWSEMPNKTIY
ncbi:MAG: nucleoside deaminase, partial [Arcobacteraceae bacterium]